LGKASMIIDLLAVNHLPPCIKRERPGMNLHIVVQCKFFCSPTTKLGISKLASGSPVVGYDLSSISILECKYMYVWQPRGIFSYYHHDIQGLWNHWDAMIDGHYHTIHSINHPKCGTKGLATPLGKTNNYLALIKTL